MNNVKTVGLLAFMTVLVVLVAQSMGMSAGSALGIAAVINLFFYFFSDKMAIAAAHARPVEEQELPQVYAMVRRLTMQAEMPMPRIYLIESPQPNAFATGRNPKHAAVAVTTGILQMLDQRELEGVLGHELSHVKNRDILISSIAAMLAAALSIVARMAFWGGGGRDNRNNPLAGIVAIVALVVGPIAALLIRMAISRTREYQADRSGAELTGQPLQLASALAKIGQATARIPMRVNPAVSQLFIDNPMKAFGPRDLLSRMFSTHPATEDRVARLQEMAYNR